MIEIDALLAVADSYKRATALEDITVSSRVFGDSKKLAALQNGADITLSRFNSALIWFSQNWPEGAEWPSDVPRPACAVVETAAPEAAE